MPEQDNREMIEGQVTEASSTDSFIARRLNRLREEIEGTAKVVDPEPEFLESKLIGGGVIPTQSEGNLMTNKLVWETSNTGPGIINPFRSRTGLTIYSDRLKKKRARKALNILP